MPRGSNLTEQHKRERERMLDQIDEAITFMRDNRLTINKKTLAEELGVCERTIYRDYIKNHLCKYEEFNPDLARPSNSANDELLRSKLAVLKAKNTDLSRKLKESEYALKELREKNAQLNQRYQRLLGVYQESFGNQITYL